MSIDHAGQLRRDLTYPLVLGRLRVAGRSPHLAPEIADLLADVVSYLDHHISTGDAARMLGISANTVKSWARLGRFPGSFQTEGGHWRFVASEVLAIRDASVRARSANASGATPVLVEVDGDPYEGVPIA
jgi:predicted DNA-binding transcriptional regulator AlpA